MLIIWNRYGPGERFAREFEGRGARVLVCENGYLGRDWLGDHWYAIAEGQHNGAGAWPVGGPERWETFGVKPCEWREGGREVIVLAQRGIGSPSVRQPDGWDRRAAELLRLAGWRVRIREHPGENPATPLELDLRDAAFCVTWGSAAGLRAILLGVPVLYGFTKWIGAPAAAPFRAPYQPVRPSRATMLTRLSWSIWRTPEIAAGIPFRRILASSFAGSRSTTARS